MQKRIAVVHRHFWPDTPPYASMLRAIAEQWSADGADVTVLTAQPSYGSATKVGRRPRVERLGSLLVRRLRVADESRSRLAKVTNMFAFPAQVAARIVAGGPADLVMCSTAPQVTLGVATSIAARMRGARFIYHCMDLHPEIGRLSGEFSRPIVYRALMALDTATMRRSDAVVVLSEDMRRAVLDRDPALAGRVVVLNNFALPDFNETEVAAPMAPPPDGTLRICFTGNIGRFQRLSEVLDALARVDCDVELVFMGDGAAKPGLQRQAGELGPTSRLRVRFLSHGSPAEARALMATSHLGLVSLEPEVVRYAYPSKTATYLCEGLPVLVLCDENSELADTVAEHAIGWATHDAKGLAAAVVEASARVAAQGDLADFASRADRYAADRFSETAALARWQVVAEDLRTDRNRNHV